MAAAFALHIVSTHAHAQIYPSKAVRVVVAFPAGGCCKPSAPPPRAARSKTFRLCTRLFPPEGEARLTALSRHALGKWHPKTAA